MTDKPKLPKDQGNQMNALSRDTGVHSNQASGPIHKEDALGPNSEIGSKLRSLYFSIQDETIPERFLDLLEKLDQAERKSASHKD